MRRTSRLNHVLVLVFTTIILPSCKCFADPVSIQGTVIDPHGLPVRDAVVSQQWRWSKTGDVVTPIAPSVRTDASGRFSFQYVFPSINGQHVAILVYDSKCREGALVDLLPSSAKEKPVLVELQPLQSVSIQLKSPLPIGVDEDVSHIYTTDGEPLEPIYGDHGTVKLPPGHYQLKVITADTKPTQQAFTVGSDAVTLPPVKLELSPMALHYGKGTPELSSLRDLDGKSFQIGSLKERWTLIYFWATWCIPCVREGMPKLIAFADANTKLSDRFRIIAIHENNLHEEGTWADFREKTMKLENDVWHVKKMPFPVAYDETTRMTSDWSVNIFPTYALVDPNGNLVRGGDLEMLKSKVCNH